LKTSTRRSTAAKSAKKAAPARKKAPPARTANLDRAIKDYEEAVKLIARKEYGRAAHLFEAVIKAYPTEREVMDRSRMYLAICKSHSAGAAPKPKSSDEHYYLGVIASNDGRLDEAVEMFDKAVKLDSGSDKALYALASACAMKGDGAAASEHLAKAIELDPRNRTLAINDSDFDSIREDPEFASLVGGQAQEAGA